MSNRSEQLKSILLLMLTAIIWGSAFVAQQVGMEHIGPFAFTFARNVLALATLVPLMASGAFGTKKGSDVTPAAHAADRRAARRMLWKYGITIGLLLTAAMNLQQIGLLYTTPGKAGFITAFYIVLIPIVLFFKGRHIAPIIWLAAVIAFVGLFLLTMDENLSVGLGELLVFICAVIYTFHIIVIERVSPYVETIPFSAIQFGVCGFISSILMLIFEKPDVSAMLNAWQSLVFAGVFSSAIAYTLQIYGQRRLSAPVASLIMSQEASFAVLAGWIILGHALSPREAIGSALMFTGVILTQLPGLLALRKAPARPPKS